MRVTQVSIVPSELAAKQNRPALTPELLAATGARYSRNNEGLEDILSKIDPANLEKSVDSIFKMIDYGHQSIADMAPVAMFIDRISIWLAYFLWSVCPTASGQESSTRYIKISVNGLITPGELGLPTNLVDDWKQQMNECFQSYQSGIDLWESISEKFPEASRIPESLTRDPSEKAQKQVARMKRNFAFDRARYFLPAAASTNTMMIMSARGWVDLCQLLLSHSLPEAIRLGEAIRIELSLVVPRLVKHAERKTYHAAGLSQEFRNMTMLAGNSELEVFLKKSSIHRSHPTNPKLEVYAVAPEPGVNRAGEALKFHENRYAWIGQEFKRTVVRFSWDAVAFAEIRDLNRHRTGSKYCPTIPVGFYCADDQVPQRDVESSERLHQLSFSGRHTSYQALKQLREGDPTYVYWLLLGTQLAFEHLTTADKFIYEAELRTGVGSHFRYAAHLRDMLGLWYEKYPETKGVILEGSAEPE